MKTSLCQLCRVTVSPLSWNREHFLYFRVRPPENPTSKYWYEHFKETYDDSCPTCGKPNDLR